VTAKKADPSNLPASIHARLLRLAKDSNEDFNVVLVRFATERLLYRLARSAHADRFVVKGAWLFYLWDVQRRLTRDVDLLGFGDPTVTSMEAVFHEILGSDVEPDGVEFELRNLQVEESREGAAYPGLRIRVIARLGQARITCQVDIGFGDAVASPVLKEELPTLLELPAPELNVYPLEAVIAEKLEAMIRFGDVNTRLKDYFDLYVLSTEMTIDGDALSRQMRETFERRGTPIPDDVGHRLFAEFGNNADRSVRWSAFLDRIRAADAARAPFGDVVNRVRDLVSAPLDAARHGRPFDGVWAGSEWIMSGAIE
jgi:predicted nucleotidyltransferase component of viral defense system